MQTVRVGLRSGRLSLVKTPNQAAKWVLPLIFFGALFYWPLGRILSMGFASIGFNSFLTPRVLSLAWFTIWQAAVSSILALLFGIPGAYVLYHRSFMGQRFLRALITVPFMLPSIVVAIGFTAFRALPLFSQIFNGHSSIPIIICANLFMNYSLAVRIIGALWSVLDISTEDAAALDGAGRLRIFISITLPQLAKSVTSAGALIFLYCAANFGLVLVLGDATTRTLETEIYMIANESLDLTKISGLVLIQSVITIAAFTVVQRFSKGQLSFNGLTSLTPKPRIDRRDLSVIAITLIFITGLIGLPLLTVLIRSFQVGDRFGLSNFYNLASHGARDLLPISVSQGAVNTLRNAGLTTFISLVIALIISFLISRTSKSNSQRRFFRVMDILFQMPLGISTLVIGIGYLLCFSGGILPLRSSWLVVPLAQSLLSIPLIIRLVYPALVSIDNELLESAQTDSANASQIWWLIELPIIRDVLLIATGYAIIVSIGEFSAASFLAYGDQATLPTILYQLISRPGVQNYGMAMATSSILIVFAYLVIYLVNSFDRGGLEIHLRAKRDYTTLR